MFWPWKVILRRHFPDKRSHNSHSVWYMFLNPLIEILPIPVAARSKAWVYGLSLAGIAGSNPAGAWIFVSCKCCLLSGGLCVGLITRPEESHRYGVSECDREPSIGCPGPLEAFVQSEKN